MLLPSPLEQFLGAHVMDVHNYENWSIVEDGKPRDDRRERNEREAHAALRRDVDEWHNLQSRLSALRKLGSI